MSPEHSKGLEFLQVVRARGQDGRVHRIYLFEEMRCDGAGGGVVHRCARYADGSPVEPVDEDATQFKSPETGEVLTRISE